MLSLIVLGYPLVRYQICNDSKQGIKQVVQTKVCAAFFMRRRYVVQGLQEIGLQGKWGYLR